MERSSPLAQTTAGAILGSQNGRVAAADYGSGSGREDVSGSSTPPGCLPEMPRTSSKFGLQGDGFAQESSSFARRSFGQKAWLSHVQTRPDLCVEEVVEHQEPPRARFTQYHGTSVPILIIFHLLPAEIAKLTLLDRFWRRILGHQEIWKGIYCRDYNHLHKRLSSDVDGVKIWGRMCEEGWHPLHCYTDEGWHPQCGRLTPALEKDGRKHCVWQSLNGRVKGGEQCLLHLPVAKSQAEFRRECDRITRIPGRSREELLASYKTWMNTTRRGKSPNNNSPLQNGASSLRGPGRHQDRQNSDELVGVPACRPDITARSPWSAQKAHGACRMVAAKPLTPKCLDLSAPVALTPRSLSGLDSTWRREISTPSTPGSNLNATTRSFNSSFAQRREL